MNNPDVDVAVETGREIAVPAQRRQQCGLDIFVANCPKCGLEIALCSEGKIICQCGALLRFFDDKGRCE